MSGETMQADWLKKRMRRHLGELLRLAWPTALSRLGIITMVMVDTMMVGQYGTKDLAWLTAGSGTIIAVFIVISVGLLLGTLILTADAYGQKNYMLCGRIWRRSLGYSFWLGVAFGILSWPGSFWLAALNLPPDVAREGGRIMQVLGFSLPANMVFLTSVFFLEGIERPKVGMYLMLVVNILNIGLNYMLVFGQFGSPELGALGSAYATMVLRNFLGLSILIYILFSPSLRQFCVREKPRDKWRDWAVQRVIGYAAGVSFGAEVVAFAGFTIFSGWMGTLALASYGIINNMLSIPFMLAAGIGAATTVRVGIAKSRNDRPDIALAGWTGLGLSSAVLGFLAMLLFVFSGDALNIYSDDPALIAYTLPLMALLASILVIDGDQGVLANALRGLGETWVPTWIQSATYFVIMIPLGYLLAIYLGRDVRGLLEAILAASVFSVLLQAAYFHKLTRHRHNPDII